MENSIKYRMMEKIEKKIYNNYDLIIKIDNRMHKIKNIDFEIESMKSFQERYLKNLSYLDSLDILSEYFDIDDDWTFRNSYGKIESFESCDITGYVVYDFYEEIVKYFEILKEEFKEIKEISEEEYYMARGKTQFLNKTVKHFKGNRYYVENINAINTETGNKMVIYRSIKDNKFFCRDESIFFSECNSEQIQKYGQKYRFTLE